MTRVSTREAVLDAALAAFTEHTYGGTAMAQVAERAGVAVGSIYRHFPSKEALGGAVYRHWKQRLYDELDAQVRGAATARTAFTALWRGLRAFSEQHPTAFAFLEHQQHERYLDLACRELSTATEAVAVNVVLDGQRAGEIRPGNPAVLVALAYGALVGLSKSVRHGLAVTDEQWSQAEDAVWDMLRATTPPPSHAA